MSVAAVPHRPPHLPPRPDRPVSRRRQGVGGPKLTVTVDISLGPEPAAPAVLRLLELIGELGSRSDSGVTVGGPPPVAAGRETATAAARLLPVGSAVGADVVPAVGTPGSSGLDQVLVDVAARVVRRAGRIVPLTRIEFDLLYFLAAHPRRVFTRRQLLDHVWGYDHAAVRTVDVHVRRLRAKVGDDLPVVTTVYGVGYRLTDDAPVMVLAD